MIREEEIKAAVEASPLLGGCNLSVSGMNVKYCHKGQIVSDRQKNEEIIGLVMEGSMDVYSIALDGREILLSQLERGRLFRSGKSLNKHGISDSTPVPYGYHIGDDAEKPASGGHGEKQ